jgi:hypothetical protein
MSLSSGHNKDRRTCSLLPFTNEGLETTTTAGGGALATERNGNSGQNSTLATSIVTYGKSAAAHPVSPLTRTDDEVDLWSKSERQILVAHELVHLHFLDDAIFGDALVIS